MFSCATRLLPLLVVVTLRLSASTAYVIRRFYATSAVVSQHSYRSPFLVVAATRGDGIARIGTDQQDDGDNGERDDECNEDGNDDAPLRAYGNRSLHWTNKYRKLLPYEKARAIAIGLGVSTKEEYLFYRKGPYMIRNPEEMYHNDWVSWDEFLGVMRPYEETRHIVRYVLKLRDMDAYRRFVKDHPKRAEGLRIPAKPDIYYRRHGGWKSVDDFFGTYQ